MRRHNASVTALELSLVSFVILGVLVIPSVHFLIRQAARERLAALRSISDEAKTRHLAMAELYTVRAQQLQAGAGLSV
ncbi:MAG: hypothetical protein ACJ8F4_00995 [Sphingomonas sp.]